jgi:hypothetical protein
MVMTMRTGVLISLYVAWPVAVLLPAVPAFRHSGIPAFRHSANVF